MRQRDKQKTVFLCLLGLEKITTRTYDKSISLDIPNTA